MIAPMALFFLGSFPVADPSSGASSAPPAGPPALAGELAAQIKSEVLKGTVEKLESFGTRHTLSETSSSTRGIGAARNWLRETMDSSARAAGGKSFTSTIEIFDAPKSARMPDGGKVGNVVGILPGTMPEAAGRTYYVVGHFDSRNGEAMDLTGDAPGANDDASGTAVVVECARVLAGHPLESTIVFLCCAGEEQGLWGAKLHAEHQASLNAPGGSGEPKPESGAEGVGGKGRRIMGVLNNDIVGDPSPGGAGANKVVRVFSEGIPRNPSAEQLAAIRNNAAESDSPSRQLARFVAACGRSSVGTVGPMLVFRPDRFLRGGDHLAFNEAGFTAVRFTTLGEDYSRQHQNVTERDGKRYGDVSSFVDGEYLAGVARLNLITLVNLANAPSPPANARILTKELVTDTTLRWEKSPEIDVAGYEVVWRATTAPDWEQSEDVGLATEKRLPLSKDNVFFGVRAYDRDGYRSPVSFAWAGKD